ncbi:hypothetical protein COO60DRAFT_1548067 [Scenedesmus sp. NREL 46B-D3]|nr:hypothetical protein COO60DRAFT_1548067 [Scenedesmus sp. NREL 46B-D3]
MTALPEEWGASGLDVNNNADIVAAAADTSTEAVTSSSSGQVTRLAYASLSAVALGCALFAGKALAAEQRTHKLASPGQVHTVTSSTYVQAQPLQLPFASVSQQQAPKAAAGAAVAAQPVVQLRQPHTVPASVHRHSFKDELHYKIRQLFAAPAVGKLLAVTAVALPIIAVGGLAYRKAVGDPDCTWREALGRTYSVLNNCPGSSVDSERSFGADVVLHLVYLAGLFTFAVVLGIVTDDISTKVDKVRCGNYPVVERNHTVLLNWNHQTLPVLKQMALAHAESGGMLFKGPVVVLADRDRMDMQEEIFEELEGSRLRVITRSGNPAKPPEQKRASAASAEAVVLMWPAGLPPAEASAQQAAVLAALKTAGGFVGQKVVVQSAGEAAAQFDAMKMAVDLARSSARSHQVASLATAGNDRMHQIMAQVVAQPGLEGVFADLLEYEGRGSGELGAELYMEPCPQHLEGKLYRHVRRSYTEATVVGWVCADDRLHLNPKDSEVVAPGSQLVFVAGVADAAVHMLETPYKVAPVKLRGRRGLRLPSQHITMLCFDAASAQGALHSAMKFSSRGSAITLVCEAPDVEALKAVKRRGIKLHIVDGNPSSRAVLAGKSARLQQAQAVMLCGLDSKEKAAADMQVVASVLQLQSLASQQHKRSKPLAVIASLNSSTTEDVLWHTSRSYHAELQAAAARAAELRNEAKVRKRRDEKKELKLEDPTAAAAAVLPPVSLHLLRPDEIMSGMLTQTACAPQLATVFSELFAQEAGHELYLRDPKRSYGVAHNTTMRWAELAELARKRGETLIGFARQNHAAGVGIGGGSSAGGVSGQLQGSQGDIRLAVHADTAVQLCQGDKLVVLALE